MPVALHGRKNQNQKTIPKLVKLEEESVQSSLVPKGTSWQMGMDHCKFLQPPGLRFNTSLSFCCSMIFGTEFLPILLSLSKAMIFFKSCMFSFHSCLYLAILLFIRLVSHTLPGVFSILLQLKLTEDCQNCSILKNREAMLLCGIPAWWWHLPSERGTQLLSLVTGCETLHIQVF